MKDPVVDPDGNYYEREAIERWLRVQSSSPITNGYLSVEMLRPSKDLKNKIYKLVGECCVTLGVFFRCNCASNFVHTILFFYNRKTEIKVSMPQFPIQNSLLIPKPNPKQQPRICIRPRPC
jgi:hypothetical protein